MTPTAYIITVHALAIAIIIGMAWMDSTAQRNRRTA